MTNQEIQKPNLVSIGVVAAIKPVEQVGNYDTQTIVIDKSYYNQNSGELVQDFHPFKFFGDNVEELDGIKKGDKVVIHFRLKGGKDKTTGKFVWLNINPYKCELLNDSSNKSVVQATPEPVTQTETVAAEDDLPF